MDDDQRECQFCDRVWGFVGVAIALAIGYVGLDLLTGGALTTALFRPTEVAADE
jgi:hypothetical protein